MLTDSERYVYALFIIVLGTLMMLLVYVVYQLYVMLKEEAEYGNKRDRPNLFARGRAFLSRLAQTVLGR